MADEILYRLIDERIAAEEVVEEDLKRDCQNSKKNKIFSI